MNITKENIVIACLLLWWGTSMFLMLAPSMSDKFKEKFAGTAYGIFVTVFSFVLPLVLALWLEFTGNIPIKNKTRVVFTVDKEGIHYVSENQASN